MQWALLVLTLITAGVAGYLYQRRLDTKKLREEALGRSAEKARLKREIIKRQLERDLSDRTDRLDELLKETEDL